jgi:hypothetical protein
MLLHFLFFPEKYQAYKEKVNSKCYSRVLLYVLPGFLHSFAPVNVVENKNRLLGCFGQQLFEIAFSRLLLVVAIDEGEVDALQFVEFRLYRISKNPFYQRDSRQ